MEYIKEILLQNNVVGNENDNNKLYVELQYVYSITGHKILNVFHIQVPESERHLGIATKVIEICEDIAQQRKLMGIFVGPFVTDDSEYLIKICKKRGYHRCMPFGMMKQFSESSVQITSVIDDMTYVGIRQ